MDCAIKGEKLKLEVITQASQVGLDVKCDLIIYGEQSEVSVMWQLFGSITVNVAGNFCVL